MKIEIIVKPSSRHESVELLPTGEYRVKVKAPPVEGRANEAVIALLAEHFRVTKKQVVIRAGQQGKRKRVEIVE